MDPARILTALAALAPVNKATAADSDEIGQKSSWTGSLTTVAGAADLAAHDELHRDERLLRQGWGVVTGVHSVDGKRRRVAVPLVTRPVRLEVARTEPFDHKIVPAGDIAVHPRLVGTEHAARLTAVLSPDRAGGDLADPSWLLAAATAAGYAVNAVTHRPEPEGAQPVVLARSVIYVSGPRTESGPIGQALLDWSERPGLEATALAAMYGTADAPEADTGPVRSSLPLNREQAAAVCSARTSPVTVVAGAPGCGKSHTLAAIALDTLARGQSVLIATQSVYAADVLARLLARRPGPAPVMFGDTENGTPAHANPGDAPRPDAAKDARRAADDALDLLERVERAIETRLDMEDRRLRALDAPVFLLDDFPGLRDADPDAVEAAAARTRGTGGWPWTRWRRRKARKELQRLAGTAADSAALQQCIGITRDLRAMTRLAADGGPGLEPMWRNLARADEDAARAAAAALLAATAAGDRRDRKAGRALAEINSARFRSSRTDRRNILANVDTAALLRARPLWIGTTADAEAILPTRAGAFDLVIIDEASHVNQLRAAPVLARAERAVIAGDPRQLKFVSFASDARLNEVLERHGLRDLEARLDTGRVSLYDLACGAGPVVELTEHHRSVPHLIGFSAAKFYGGRVRPMTAHPRLQETDAITVHRVAADTAAEDGTVPAEAERAVDLLAELVAAGDRGLAVLSPFRAQAEAIEAAVMKRFDLDAIRAHRIRTGTVHAFQGSESETVIASLGTAPGDSAGRKRFLSGANLFNVMVTRAREHLHVVTALDDPGGLVGEFLDHADRAPAPLPGDGTEGAWPAKLADALSGADAAVRHGYPVGHWKIDLVVGEGDAAFGVLCAVHPDGPRAHIERQRALARAGWRLVDAFPSTYADDASRAAVAVLAELGR
ncbi:AAA domain-containing protein [Glycomyces mayteni]|uniref:AAA domain-containing protein n=1 Tax=Glycomyces mayteni TaxID=543887 RepID=A0ABW2DDG3_9ACTN